MKPSEQACKLVEQIGGTRVASSTKGSAFEFDDLSVVVGDRTGMISMYTTQATSSGRKIQEIVSQVPGASIARKYPGDNSRGMSGFANRNLPKGVGRVLVHFQGPADLHAFLRIALSRHAPA